MRGGSVREMRDASWFQSTAATGTSPSTRRSSAPSCASRAGSAESNGLNVRSSDIESAIVCPEVRREDAPQLPACLVKVPSYGAGRELHQLADLRARHAVDVEHRDDHPLPIGERRERFLQNLPRV